MAVVGIEEIELEVLAGLVEDTLAVDDEALSAVSCVDLQPGLEALDATVHPAQQSNDPASS